MPIKTRVDIRAPWTPAAAENLADTLTGFFCDGEAFSFLVVWFHEPGALTVQVSFAVPPAQSRFFASVIAQNVVGSLVE